jgi:hypothetical protein
LRPAIRASQPHVDTCRLPEVSSLFAFSRP